MKGSRYWPVVVVLGGLVGTAAAAAGEADSVRFRQDRDRVELYQGGRTVATVRSPKIEIESAVAAEGGFVVAGLDADGRVAVRLAERPRTGQSANAFQKLPRIPARNQALELSPVLLDRDGRIDGIAWLEGGTHQRLTVRAAVWNGSSWERSERVSAPIDGPQLALSGAVLEDGSWLLVWAGFDGEDDEIFWSLRSADAVAGDIGAWSSPRRLHRDNRVPDVIPSVVANREGALAAWSWFDGNDYRVRSAVYSAGRWRIGEVLPGRGGVDAAWETLGSKIFLTYRSVVPDFWSAFEVRSFGSRSSRLASAPGSLPDRITERPLLRLEGGAPTFVPAGGLASSRPEVER